MSSASRARLPMRYGGANIVAQQTPSAASAQQLPLPRRLPPVTAPSLKYLKKPANQSPATVDVVAQKNYKNFRRITTSRITPKKSNAAPSFPNSHRKLHKVHQSAIDIDNMLQHKSLEIKKEVSSEKEFQPGIKILPSQLFINANGDNKSSRFSNRHRQFIQKPRAQTMPDCDPQSGNTTASSQNSISATPPSIDESSSGRKSSSNYATKPMPPSMSYQDIRNLDINCRQNYVSQMMNERLEAQELMFNLKVGMQISRKKKEDSKIEDGEVQKTIEDCYNILYK